ncbi:MAG TPA: VWA domain-containing protein [Xanthomonadaceae bacterium]|nr:VWA domain-containing protein [Xanthomonadaceae bacterium]
MHRTRLAISIALCLVAAGCSTTQTSPTSQATPPTEQRTRPVAETNAVADVAKQAAKPGRDEQAQANSKEEDKKDSGAVNNKTGEREQPYAAVSDGPAPMAVAPPPPAEAMLVEQTARANAPIGYPVGGLDRVDVAGARVKSAVAMPAPLTPAWNPAQAVSAGEKYAAHDDNPVQRTAENPVSTFSIDVDTGSYSNVRRMLTAGQRPPADAVRAEEMINYFDYAYPAPTSRAVPFKVTTEMAPTPWNPKHTLLQIGIKGYEVARTEIPPANLVFLIDTSGSMDEPNKLPLLKQSFALLVPHLRAQDRVAIVVYAGSAGLVLPSTPGDHHAEILAALDQLQAGGSTNGGAGIGLAYAQARSSFIKGGANRIILATDGDFNVGVSDTDSLKEMVAKERESGVALTTLGFGVDNYNDTMAEQLADIGDGNHAYIDTLAEGRKVFVDEMSATLLTIAKDVKIQMEFNPAVVSEYRLIGYEDRALRREDFNNDKVDAGEIGAGHNVTALYELTLAGSGGEANDPLRYGKALVASGISSEVGLLRLRYKQPGAQTSKLIEMPLQLSQISANASPRLRFAASVAAFADELRGGKHLNGYSWDAIGKLARGTGGVDRWGYRAEFEQLVERASSMDRGTTPVATAR